MQKSFFLSALLFLLVWKISLFATISMWPGDGSVNLSKLTGNIQIEKRQLVIDGIPFVMKGVCYEPVRFGETIPGGIMTLHPTSEDLLIIEKDFQMMKEAGINTIRTYEPITDPRILELLNKYQLRTIVPICHALANSQDLETIADNIEILKNEPSTLIWEIGNEWNLNFFYNWDASLDRHYFLEFIKSIALFIRKKDTLHPISTNIIFPVEMGLPDYQETYVGTTLPDFVDLYGINFYNGLGFGSSYLNPQDTSAFDLWKKTSEKPFYIGEYGTDAWNTAKNSYDPNDQNFAISFLTTTILNNLSAVNKNNILIGGCLFEWCDEWWKDNTGSMESHLPGGIKHPTGGPWPDHCHNGAWFGIVDINRVPRPSYDTLKMLFTDYVSEIVEEKDKHSAD